MNIRYLATKYFVVNTVVVVPGFALSGNSFAASWMLVFGLIAIVLFAVLESLK